MSRSFTNLLAWRQARRLVRPVYDITSRFPAEEKYVLIIQMRKAAHSVHSNIAEGRGRLSNGEWQQFLGQSRGSLMELESQVIAAYDLRYCSREEAAEITRQIRDVARLVNGLLRASVQGFETKKYRPAKQ